MTDPDVPYDCAQQGHIWLEATGISYVRHRGRERGPIAVECQYCPATAEMEGHSDHVAPPQKLDDLDPKLTYREAVAKADAGPVPTD